MVSEYNKHMNKIEITQREIALAGRVASRVAEKWSLAETEDLQSELILWLYDNASTVARYRFEEKGEGKLYVALRRTAGRIAAMEQVARSGSYLDADAKYSITQIENALTAMFDNVDVGAIRVNPVTHEPIQTWDPRIEEAKLIVLEVRSAWELLDDLSQLMVAWRYMNELTYREIADLSGMSPTGARKKLKHILRKIQASVDGSF